MGGRDVAEKATLLHRLLLAVVGGAAGSLAFFAGQAMFIALMPLDWEPLPEPWDRVVMYAPVALVSGVIAVGVVRWRLHCTWAGASTLMLMPYLLVALLAFGGALIHAQLSGNAFGFIHTTVFLYVLPGVGAATGALVAGVWQMGRWLSRPRHAA